MAANAPTVFPESRNEFLGTYILLRGLFAVLFVWQAYMMPRFRTLQLRLAVAIVIPLALVPQLLVNCLLIASA